MADLNKLAEDIVGLTLLQAQELKTILKDKYGIEPAAGGAVMMAAGPAAAAAPAEEQTEFDVVLTEAGGKVKEAVGKADAEAIKKTLEAAGAKVELK